MRTVVTAGALSACLLLLSHGGAAQAQDGAPKGADRVQAFGAGPGAASAADTPEGKAPAGPAGPKTLLAECDRRLDICSRDAIGVPYLAAAYIALWGILLAFVFFLHRGQRGLEAELGELRARLRELSEDSG